MSRKSRLRDVTLARIEAERERDEVRSAMERMRATLQGQQPAAKLSQLLSAALQADVREAARLPWCYAAFMVRPSFWRVS